MAESEQPRYSLRHRITITVLAVFLIGIWILWLVGTRMLRSGMERVLAVQQASTAAYAAGELNEELEARRRMLEALARSIDVQQLARLDVLQNQLESHPMVSEMFNAGVVAVAADGMATAPMPFGSPGAESAGPGAIRIALEGRKGAAGPLSQRSAFKISTPIRNGSGKVIGSLSGTIDLTRPNFLDHLARQRYGNSGAFMVIDLQQDVVVAATDRNRGMQSLPARGSNHTLDKRRSGFVGSEVTVNSVGVEVLSSASRVPSTGWLVVATLPTEEAFAPVRAAQQYLLIASLALTLAGGVLFWWLLRRDFAPLRAAVDALGRMSRGDQPPQPLPVARRDEIGQLVGGFNRLLGKLSEHEARIEAERNFFSAVLQQASDGVLLFDPADMRICEANPSLCRMLGYPREELLRLEFGALLFEPGDCSQERLAQIVQQKQPLTSECKFRTKDGAAVAVEVSAGLVETGGRRLIMVNLRDLTERILLEHRLAQSQQHMELALLGADLGLWDWHIPSGVVTYNARWGQMLGYALDEIEPCVDSWSKLIHPEDWHTALADMRAHLRGRTPSFRCKHRLRHKDGHWVWVLARGRVVERDAGGAPLRAAGTCLDISAQKQAELAHGAAQQKTEQLLRRIEALMRHAGDCIMMLDRDTRILEVSDACPAAYGYTREELLTMRAVDLRAPEAQEPPDEFVNRLAQHGSRLYQTWHRRKDGSAFPVEIGAAVIDDADERFIQVIIRDISERVRERSSMEHELAAYARRLEAASRRVLAVQEESKRRFSGELHDRTSPNLAAIRINLGIIARLAASQSRERAERLEDTCALIDDTEASLREICAELRPPVLDYAGLAAALESHAQHFSARTGIVVRLDCARGRRRLAPAMESLLFRIYQEALTNSLKHAHATTVDVVLASSNGPVSLTIADDGEGFDLKMLENDEHAYGLGLLNMREMVAFSGGHFAIESQPGHGTRIEVTL